MITTNELVLGAVLVVSEILPFIETIDPNGILHLVLKTLLYFVQLIRARNQNNVHARQQTAQTRQEDQQRSIVSEQFILQKSRERQARLNKVKKKINEQLAAVEDEVKEAEAMARSLHQADQDFERSHKAT